MDDGAASVVVVTFADTQASLRILHHVRQMRPELPVVVRGADEADVERLGEAGATEVVPEALESSVMLATHALALLGVPMHKVIKRLREVREKRYSLLRGFFHGATDTGDRIEEADQPRLHAVLVTGEAWAIGKPANALGLEAVQASISALRRHGEGAMPLTTPLAEGDVIVVLGTPPALAAAEEKILAGK